MKDQCHDEFMSQKFRSDAKYLTGLIKAVLLDGDEGEVEILRRQVEIVLRIYDSKGGESEATKRKFIPSCLLSLIR